MELYSVEIEILCYYKKGLLWVQATNLCIYFPLNHTSSDVTFRAHLTQDNT